MSTKTSSNQKGSLLEEKSLEKLPFAYSAEKKRLFRIFVGQERKEKKVARVIEKE